MDRSVIDEHPHYWNCIPLHPETTTNWIEKLQRKTTDWIDWETLASCPGRGELLGWTFLDQVSEAGDSKSCLTCIIICIGCGGQFRPVNSSSWLSWFLQASVGNSARIANGQAKFIQTLTQGDRRSGWWLDQYDSVRMNWWFDRYVSVRTSLSDIKYI